MTTRTDDRLSDRHVAVTGGARGVGRGIAVRCARAGADVTVFDTKPDVAEETASLVRETGSQAAVYEVDVTDESAVEAAVRSATDERGPIHGLVNNAGIQRAVPLLETSEVVWDGHFEVNAKGTFLVSKVVAASMVDAGTADTVVNISSVGAERPFRRQGAYGASKAVVLAFTTVLAKDLSDHDITVNAVKPGTVETPMVEQWLEFHPLR
ncbi:short-chain family oxidoreductase [Halogeometricum pallidum JCM 14848]|uniref:Short-chain family oxidoreductase n=1 Tax=Halogeometricum pallidum JCM 14848 TaxID=1227487 RepID=M0CXW9_HALPD|nr:short-chain family oxidoreductase [Halogeometricum pallidum JCM 14848]